MKILVVGGTGFLGSAIVNVAVSLGHDVKVLSRGISTPLKESKVEILACNRYEDLSLISQYQFDAVFDTCAFGPDAVVRLLDALNLSSLKRYVYISSTSVYDEYSQVDMSEDAPVSKATSEQLSLEKKLPIDDRTSAFSYGDAYGPLKSACESTAIERLGDRALIMRSGLLVGAGDYTDRLTWWVRRIDQGGKIPIPAPPDRLIQLIDVRDAATFAMHCIIKELSGIYNLISRPFSMEELLSTINQVAGSKAEFVWIDEEHFLSSGFTPWSEVPFWVPRTEGGLRYFLELSVEKAYKDGLQCRALDETIIDILKWDRENRSRELKGGFSSEKGTLLLKTFGC